MKKLLHCFVLLITAFGMVVAPIQAVAQALPASRVAMAVGKTLKTKMTNRGFAANDPRFSATLAAAEITLIDVAVTAASAGGAAAIGAIGAPVWLTIGGSLAVGYGFQLALDYWMPGLPSPMVTGVHNPPMQITSGSPVPTVTYPVTVYVPNPDTTPSDPVFPDMGWYGGSPIEGISNYYNYINSQPQDRVSFIATNVQASPQYFTFSSNDGLIYAHIDVTWTRIECRGAIDVKPNCTGTSSPVKDLWGHLYGGSCPDGYMWGGSACMPPAMIDQTENASGTTQDIANGNIAVHPGLKESPLNPEIISRIADNAWSRAASMPGYQGIPYSPSDPVTPADVETAYNPVNNPAGDPYPTVNDALSPVSPPGTQIVINLNPAPAPAPNPSMDLGPDPGISTPSLEATPTAQQILDPLLNLFPSLRSFVVPQHSSECPKPSADVFGKHIVMDGHCALLDAARPTLYAVMAFVWVALSLLIILAA